MSDSLRPHESQHIRPPSPSPTPRVYSNSCPLSRWCHPAISSSVIPFSSCPQSLPASGSFPMSQLFASGGRSIGVSASASVLPMNTQDWSPLGWTGWISLQSKGLRVYLDLHKYVCICVYIYIWSFLSGSAVKNPPANAGDTDSILELGRAPKEGNDNPLHYSFLGSPMDRGA